ncbi:MAG: HNH endonuclease signature motif containing protein [Chloroflexi bacterium]|nr:HNH endonuclease signature motif containing protein [Chloroflexota bacterium]
MSKISPAMRQKLAVEAQERCGYCQSQQQYALGRLEIDHIIPIAAGGNDHEENLWLSCRLCNSYKGTQTTAVDPLSGRVVALFNPRQQVWAEHFVWSGDGTQIVGLTPCGRATVMALQLNNVVAVMVRQAWVRAGWHPPEG